MSNNLAESYEYVIIGGGTAADKAARAIVKGAPGASVLILSSDSDGPVYRPDLSKTLWKKSGDQARVENSLLGTGDLDDVTLALQTTVTALDPQAHTVTATTASGSQTIGYRKVLIATGATPNKPLAIDDPRVVYLRTSADYRALRERVTDGTRAVVAGGGYIGSEIAAALANNGARTTMLYLEQRLLERMFPESITQHLEETYRAHGVELHPGFKISEITVDGDHLVVTDGAKSFDADVVAVGFGVHPNLELAEAAGLTLDGGGILVDAQLRTSAADVYAAGDVMVFDDPLFGRRRVEHVDNAEHSGSVAGANMAGGEESYDYTPIFWSDLFDDGYEAMGSLDARAEVIERWNDDRTAAVLHYVRDGKPIGVLLWNTWDSTGKAKQVVADVNAGTISVADLAGTIQPG
ncbi:NAD(P)/FAD-dependent oxidoreductase [Granulicoccus phenolivorans]|uniref:NAD(P)/FAD-dependent oxidoreductase n=1 Tax=Granulicoccus phenolivorans TaxID=266854 RepID=UPI00040F0DCD|nr:FAD/NAD(P)-binding oxidoreductase [Granulicoccus phenolivorans]